MITSGGPAVECSNLFKTYSEGLLFRKQHQALKGISFEVGQGEVFGLLGPNGAGKTTFIKILLGIIRRTSGGASMLGYSAGSHEARKHVGYLPENLRIPRHLNAFTALDYFGNLSNLSSREVRSRRDESLEMVGLAGRASDSVRKYSKGMLQRLGLAQALLHRPKLLVLDEPTDGLDPQARAEVRRILSRLSDEGVTIFLNSHILQEVELVCDRVAILDRGQLRYCGAVSEIDTYVRGRREDAASQATPAEDQYVVTLELQGDLPLIRAAVTTHKVIEEQVEPNGSAIFKLGLRDQQAVDQLVDQLRAGQVSILGLQRRQISLEDAFLEIIAEKVD